MVSIPVTAFAHLNAEKGALYRAILAVFVYERARFTIALRPLEIAACLAVRHAADPDSSPSASDNELTAALEQLVAWNNLLATRDTADVATVEEFYRSRYLYQLSAEGEAAEHAISAFFQHLHRPGELQVATLRDLLTLLEQLAAELAAEPDRDRLHLAFQTLVTRFEELTSRAQSFMRSLQSTVELHGIELDAFFSYKDALIDHLDRFLGELVLSTSRITAALHELAALDLDRAFRLLAGRHLADALQPTANDFAAAADHRRQRVSQRVAAAARTRVSAAGRRVGRGRRSRRPGACGRRVAGRLPYLGRGLPRARSHAGDGHRRALLRVDRSARGNEPA